MTDEQIRAVATVVAAIEQIALASRMGGRSPEQQKSHIKRIARYIALGEWSTQEEKDATH